MTYNVSSKNCRISKLWLEEIIDNINKTLRHLPNLDSGVELLDFVIKKHRGKDFYEVSITLYLPIKNLHAHYENRNPQECIHGSFEKIIEEVKRYKEKHLVSDSSYFRRDTIRKK